LAEGWQCSRVGDWKNWEAEKHDGHREVG
jgi:hypothetical protein